MSDLSLSHVLYDFQMFSTASPTHVTTMAIVLNRLVDTSVCVALALQEGGVNKVIYLTHLYT